MIQLGLLTWTVTGEKLSSFWEPPDAPSQYGDGFSQDIGNDTFENLDCHGSGTCEVSRIHYVYLDQKQRNPQSVEWRDESGNLRYAAYYESYHNWTHRQIWVWSAALGERKLYETDVRSISYWPQQSPPMEFPTASFRWFRRPTDVCRAFVPGRSAYLLLDRLYFASTNSRSPHNGITVARAKSPTERTSPR
jgi:hypothetical protein